MSTAPPQGSADSVGDGVPERAAGQPAAPRPLPQHEIRRTKVGGVWVASALFAVVLLLLLIFILQNGHKVEISYLGAHGHLPLGVALLMTAVVGVLLVVIPGTGRIIQLRVTARRHRKADVAAAGAPGLPGGASSPQQPPTPHA
jgi:uncharacterized integral membrane protein